MQLNVISALCRIWDATKGAASISEAAKRLPKLRGLAVNRDELDEWLKNVEAVERSEVFRAIHGYRNVGLAHRHDPNKLDPRAMSGARRVKHHDERKLLEATIVIVEGLYDLLTLNGRQDFAKRREEWRDRSGKFWSSIR